LIEFLNIRKHLDKLAFDAQIDSTGSLIKRQLFARINDLPLDDRPQNPGIEQSPKKNI
jgi:hypothetical protein